MRRYLIFIPFLLIHTFSIAQDKAERVLQILDEKYPQEKIHLFFNREAFVAGETIFFKAYVFSGYVLSFISTNLYVELYNEKKELLDKTIIPLINASGEGSLDLEQELDEGVYYVRAYTKWMLNFSEEFQYINSFPVYNINSSKVLVPKLVKWAAAIYPESGSLIANEENKVAIRLIPEGSLPKSWSGYVTEKNDPTKRVTSFSSLNPQISSFSFTPVSGREYAVHISDVEGNTFTTSVTPQLGGVVLKAAQNQGNLNLQIIFRGLPNAGMNFKLIGQMQDQVVLKAIINKKDTNVRLSIPINKLMNGVLHLALFNESEKVIAERLVFLQNHSLLPLDLDTTVLSSAPRKPNKWGLSVDTPQFNSYAIAISDAQMSMPRKRSIYSDLWLGDFTSDIHNPNWYFTSTDSNRLLALDALLLTEKWRRFAWNKIIADSFNNISYQPEKYLSYSGTITHNGKTVSDANINLMFKYKDSSLQYAQVKTDKMGRFYIQNVAFYDTVNVFYQGSSTKGAPTEIEVLFETENKFIPYNGKYPELYYSLAPRKENSPLPIVGNVTNAINNQKIIDNKYNQLEEVKVMTKANTAKEQLNEKLASPLFNTENETVFDFVNEDQGIQAYTHIFDWLDGRVSGLNFTIKHELHELPHSPLTNVGQRRPIMRDGEVAVYLDEMPTDLETIYNLSVNDIAMVKVIKGFFLGGVSGGGGSGAIAVYTKRSGLQKKSTLTSPPLGFITGYRLSKPYHQLNYIDDFSKTAIRQDTRDLLYWNAVLHGNEMGKINIEFYNNDVSSAFRIVMTGFTKDARPVFWDKVITPTKN